MKIDRSKFLSLCVALVTAGTAACGAADDGADSAGSNLNQNDPAGGAGAGVNAATAAGTVVTVESKSITSNTNGCAINIQMPVVKIPSNKAMETAINKALAPLGESDMSGPCKESGGGITSNFAVTANANGLLSIKATGEAHLSGQVGDGTIKTASFDIKNGGKQLQLFDVVTEAGLNKAIAECTSTIDGQLASIASPPDPSEPQPTETIGSSTCNASLKPDAEFRVEPLWAATDKGLEAVISVSHAQGAFVTVALPWKDMVTDGLKPSVVLDFAKAH